MTEPILKATGLTKRYGRVVALDNCDFELMPGEILAVIGDNGAGKSTLIKAVSGAVIPDAGRIELEGREVRFNTPIAAREAGIETIHERQDHEVEREAVTASTDGESATVPTLDDPTPEHVPLLSDNVAARRGESLLLVNLLSLGDRFSVARYRADLGGFLVAWGLVAGFLVLAVALTAWLG
ncbi:MAG: ATP-binding cassette domain-containing protein [Pseudomonadota bacterium]